MQFEEEPWPVLLHPRTVAAMILLAVRLDRTVCIEDIMIRAVGPGEVPVEKGPISRFWEPQ
jgi:hypothetical protein